MPNRPLLAVLCLLLASGCALFRPRPPEYPAVVLDSGLVVQDLVVPEEGVPVAVGDTVAVHYDLWLGAGETFLESSRDQGIPVRFEVGAGTVPRGLEEGVVGMRLFGRRRLEVPGALGFGAAGRPPNIPADATLRFELELMEHSTAEP
jgi:FKBP-type peptidyl-prolyl cis-trans isomerase FkpA